MCSLFKGDKLLGFRYYEIYCSFVVAAQAQEIGQMHGHITALEREIAKDSPKVPVFALIFLTKVGWHTCM